MKAATMNIGESSGQLTQHGDIHNHGPVTSIQVHPGGFNIAGDQYQIHFHLTLPSAEILASLIDLLNLATTVKRAPTV